MNREPTAVIAAFGGFLASLVKVAQLLGIVDLDGDQMAGVTLVIDNFLLLMGALFIRSQVTPANSHARLDEGTTLNHGMSVVARVPDPGADPEAPE
jgi:hypothetical protein